MDRRLLFLLALLTFTDLPHVQGQASALDTAAPGAPPRQAGFFYAETCGGRDIGEKIMDCAKRLPTGTDGYKSGTIILPNSSSKASQRTWATAVTLGPGVNLMGQGLLASVFVCTVDGDCLKHDASGASGPTKHSVIPNTTYQGFAIRGVSGPHQNILHLVDSQNLSVRDFSADGAGGAGGSCIWLEDVNWFTERDEFINVSTLYSCRKGLRFSVATGNPFEPLPSFGYNRFLDFKSNPNGNQVAVSLEDDAYCYASTFVMTVNKAGMGAKVIHLQDKAQWFNNDTHIFGEEQGSGGSVLELVSPSNVFTYFGQFYFQGSNDNPHPVYSIAAGAFWAHFADEAGPGPPLPIASQAGFIANAIALSAGFDVDQLSQVCGSYSGRQLVHAPAAAGTGLIKITVACSLFGSASSTQTVYLGEGAAGEKQRTWQRMFSNRTWGPWREFAWVDELPLAGLTNALPVSPIAPGSCTEVKARISGATTQMSVIATPSAGMAVVAGLHWDTAYVDTSEMVIVPICNSSGTSIKPNAGVQFNVRVLP